MTPFRFKPLAFDNGFEMPDYWLWCPSVIRGPNGEFHLFASRWPKSIPMHPGWMTHSEVVRAVAPSITGPYTFKEVVLPARGPEYWDGRSTHNPTIRFHGGRYYLFYTGSTHPLPDLKKGEPFPSQDPRCIVARSMKRVGIAWAESLEGPWHRLDHPILPTEPDSPRSFLTSNPAPFIYPDGKTSLVFKQRAYRPESRDRLGFAECGEPTHGEMTLGLAEAPDPLGPYEVTLAKIDFPGNSELEDPFLWRDEEGFHLLAKELTGRLSGVPGGCLLAHSGEGRVWEFPEAPLAFRKEVSFEDGSTLPLGSLERPFLYFEAGRPTHLLAAASNGSITFTDASRTWIAVCPLEG